MSALTALYKDLLFLDGHVADPELAVALSTPATPRAAVRTRSQPMTFFKSLMYLGGLESVDLRVNEDGSPFGPTYGNRLASEQFFGPTPHAAAAPREQRQADRRRAPRAAAQAAACH